MIQIFNGAIFQVPCSWIDPEIGLHFVWSFCMHVLSLFIWSNLISAFATSTFFWNPQKSWSKFIYFFYILYLPYCIDTKNLYTEIRNVCFCRKKGMAEGNFYGVFCIRCSCGPKLTYIIHVCYGSFGLLLMLQLHYISLQILSQLNCYFSGKESCAKYIIKMEELGAQLFIYFSFSE